jgi:hypothetical protein
MQRFQLVIDCADPDKLARFRAEAFGYVFEPPPEGFATWDDYWRDFGLGEDDLGLGEDSIVDPNGHGPRIWFQIVPEGRQTVSRRLAGLLGGWWSCPRASFYMIMVDDTMNNDHRGILTAS